MKVSCKETINLDISMKGIKFLFQHELSLFEKFFTISVATHSYFHFLCTCSLLFTQHLANFNWLPCVYKTNAQGNVVGGAVHLQERKKSA